MAPTSAKTHRVTKNSNKAKATTPATHSTIFSLSSASPPPNTIPDAGKPPATVSGGISLPTPVQVAIPYTTPPKNADQSATTTGKRPKKVQSLQNDLQTAAAAATARANEGTQLFGPIADMLDKYRNDEAHNALSPHLTKALAAFCDDFSTVARRHIDAHIRGSQRPPRPYEAARNDTATPPTPGPPPAVPTAPRGQFSQPAPTGKAPSRPSPTPRTPSFADIATSPAPTNTSKPSTSATAATPKVKAPGNGKADTRVFVRLPQTHKARNWKGYTILATLKEHFKDLAALIREVQPTKTGFALTPSKVLDPAAFESVATLAKQFFGDTCTIEKAQNWISYRLQNVPRTIGRISPDHVLLTDPVDASSLAIAIVEATGLTPVSITQTKASESNDDIFPTSWFVNFPESSKASLPPRIQLLGALVSTKFLDRKVNTIQCTNCYHWHNTRVCSRSERCRLCGSTKHSEADHPAKCGGNHPHTCPHRCLHCHGPHAADDEECPLRPSSGRLTLNKTQTSEIRSASSTARLRACAEVGCPNDTKASATKPPPPSPADSLSSQAEVQAPGTTEAPPPSADTTPAVDIMAVDDTPSSQPSAPTPPNRFQPLQTEEQL